MKRPLVRLLTISLLFLLTGCSTPGIPSTNNQVEVENTITQEGTTEKSSETIDITEAPIKEETNASVKEPEVIQLSRSEEILQTMTLEEKVGQMFIARCPEENAASLIGNYQLGGIILFSRDFKEKTKDQVIHNIQSYQDSSKLSLLVGVDEEGGTVNRVSLFPAFREVPFRSPQALFATGGLDLIQSDTVEKSNLLKSLGINVNLAPVCDVSTNPSDYINARSFGKDATKTAQYVKTVVGTMVDEQIGSVLKHFPGYGNNIDTHTGIAYDERPYNTFVESDFIPFQAGIDAGADAVLVSHNIIKSMDEQYPASLSPEVHRILREELQFEGVIMTDDLVMDAIKQYTGTSEAAVLAVLAGNDMLCCTDFEVQIPAVIQAVKDGTIAEEQIEQSVLRILDWKLKLGIIE